MFASKQLIQPLRLEPNSIVKLILKASICHKSELPPRDVYHWPYEKKSWNLRNFLYDPFTRKKFNENTKIIQVEGNISCGKKIFAQKLADELGMKYIEPVDLESYYINDHGYDYRALNMLLPERLRLCDWSMFHENPARHSVIHMQYVMFKLRLFQYIKALQHLFNTGQGVVMTRSVFTERVFVEAMHNIGWLPMGYLRGDGARFYDYKMRYTFTRNLALADVMKPHLTIYLETPVDTCMSRIKDSEDLMVKHSRALVPEFLEGIEKAYEDIVLPRQDRNGHLLRYEYPKEMITDEILDVVDDIKKLDFSFSSYDTRFEDWNDDFMLWYWFKRRELTNEHCLQPILWLNQPWFDIAGLGDSITENDLILRRSLFEAHVGPFGFFRSLEVDVRLQTPFQAFLGRLDFGQTLERHVRSDFV